jgi:hypothetical protein
VDKAYDGGVVMKMTVPKSVLITSPDVYAESEVLIQGPVTGAKTTIIIRH